MKTIAIEYINGENRRDTMRRVQRILTETGKRLGLSSASYSKDISVLVNELIQTKQDQYITIREGRNAGRFTRRTPAPTIPLAVKSPVRELDKYIQDSIPDAIYGKMLNLTPREVALQEALKTQVGLSSKVRVPHMEPESRLLAANIVGSLPTGGQGIEEAAKKKLSATVKQALGDLGIDAEGENKKRLLERLQAKPFFNDPVIISNFSNFLHIFIYPIDYWNLSPGSGPGLGLGDGLGDGLGAVGPPGSPPPPITSLSSIQSLIIITSTFGSCSNVEKSLSGCIQYDELTSPGCTSISVLTPSHVIKSM